MDDVEELLVDALLGNPFATAPELLAKAEAAFDATDVGQLITRAVARGDDRRAEELTLAAGHLEARRNPLSPRQVLTPPTLPSRVATRLPRGRADYLRLVMAAGRCHQSLLGMLGTSRQMHALRRDIWASCFGQGLRHALHLERVIRDDDLLILGETGTGKESVAAAVQAATGGSKDGGPAPSSTLNAAALPETLVESELFGYVKGAFTGAADTRPGRIRSADGGCFFLDEVGDLPAHTQVKLLRVIESDEVAPLGSDTLHKVDVRFVAATHRDLEQMVEAEQFRRDLFQRLAGNVIRVPPLRDRPEDIPVIGAAFVRRYLADGELEELVEDVEKWLASDEARSYPWPGNVRELQNVIRSRILGLGARLHGLRPLEPADTVELPPRIKDCVATLRDVELWYLQRVLAATEENYAQTARILGVDRSTVRRRSRSGR